MKKEISFKHVKSIDQTDKRSAKVLHQELGTQKGARHTLTGIQKNPVDRLHEHWQLLSICRMKRWMLAKGNLA
jgi:hypothetical protein